jgi:hypothetical protein
MHPFSFSPAEWVNIENIIPDIWELKINMDVENERAAEKPGGRPGPGEPPACSRQVA